MRPGDLKKAREGAGLMQQQAADRLGVSQAYWALMESGRRRVTEKVGKKMVRVLPFPAEALPMDAPDGWSAGRLAAALAAALLLDDLETRVVEALPWLVEKHPGLDWNWLLARAKLGDAQNRLGFLVQLALERGGGAEGLRGVLGSVERARLVREDTLCQASATEAERRWLRKHRSGQRGTGGC